MFDVCLKISSRKKDWNKGMFIHEGISVVVYNRGIRILVFTRYVEVRAYIVTENAKFGGVFPGSSTRDVVMRGKVRNPNSNPNYTMF